MWVAWVVAFVFCVPLGLLLITAVTPIRDALSERGCQAGTSALLITSTERHCSTARAVRCTNGQHIDSTMVNTSALRGAARIDTRGARRAARGAPYGSTRPARSP
jgi:hypothetical protein